MKIITFSGVDGSGKSTQLEILRKRLEAEGKKVAYFHMIEFSLANRISHIFRSKPRAPGTAKAITHASPLGIILRQKLLFLDLLRFRFFKRKLEREGYEYLLSDRYFYDSLLNLEYLALPYTGSFLLFLWDMRRHFLEHFMVRPEQAFYIRVTSESILKRERVPEQGQKYLDDKIGLFEKFAPLWGMQTINGDSTSEIVADDIAQNIL